MLGWMCKNVRLLTLNIVAGHELQHLINENDREGKLQDHQPLFCVQMGQLEDHLGGERVDVRAVGNSTEHCNFNKNCFSEVYKPKPSCGGNECLTYGQRVNIDDHEVQRHGQGHGRDQPEVAPWGHAHQRQAGKRKGHMCCVWKKKKQNLSSFFFAVSFQVGTC